MRIGWADLPPRIRGALERIIGSAVTSAVSQPGGFTPGTADRVTTADGRRAFVKAVSTSQNAASARMARSEARITARLPPAAPVPRLIGTHDDGEWVALVFEDIEGRHPRTPWVEDEVAATVTALHELGRLLTPAPFGAPQAADNLAADFAGWAGIAADPPADLDRWAAAHLGELRAAADHGLTALRSGETLTHGDIRADNLLVRPDGSIVVVDWPWAGVGPQWLDTVLLAMNVLFHGGDSDSLLDGIDPDAATGVIAGFTGYFLDISRRPHTGIPHVRDFQRAQGDALLPWLRGRLG